MCARRRVVRDYICCFVCSRGALTQHSIDLRHPLCLSREGFRGRTPRGWLINNLPPRVVGARYFWKARGFPSALNWHRSPVRRRPTHEHRAKWARTQPLEPPLGLTCGNHVLVRGHLAERPRGDHRQRPGQPHQTRTWRHWCGVKPLAFIENKQGTARRVACSHLALLSSPRL